MLLNQLPDDIQALFPPDFNLNQDINEINEAVINEVRSTPLTYAVSINNVPLVKALLEQGADPNLRRSDDRLPMTVALTQPPINVDILRLLIQHQANFRADFQTGFNHASFLNYLINSIYLVTGEGPKSRQHVLIPAAPHPIVPLNHNSDDPAIITNEMQNTGEVTQPIHRISELFPLSAIQHLEAIPEHFRFRFVFDPNIIYRINDPNSPLSILTAAIFEQLQKVNRQNLRNPIKNTLKSSDVGCLPTDVLELCAEYALPFSAGIENYLVGEHYSEDTRDWLMDLGRIHHRANQQRAGIIVESNSIMPSHPSWMQVRDTNAVMNDNNMLDEDEQKRRAETNTTRASSSTSSRNSGSDDPMSDDYVKTTDEKKRNADKGDDSDVDSDYRPPIPAVTLQLMGGDDDFSQGDIMAAMFGGDQNEAEIDRQIVNIAIRASLEEPQPGLEDNRPHIEIKIRDEKERSTSGSAPVAPVLFSGGIDKAQARIKRLKALESRARGGSQASSSASASHDDSRICYFFHA